MNGGVRGSAQLSAKSPQQKHKTPRFSEESRGVFVAPCGEGRVLWPIVGRNKYDTDFQVVA